ncbi:MFS general substrate transporter [Massarina eburnea CBS 473.64]|uniref:MFS general substrate transporter n=1 Tax=Massarina eburnea CBS 473.64 TaxID=1395130 RepID=A0A6A6RTK0_9PLEO|nr:MFS general substrate transporter [Massarina eburnea CBS 473.64]
MAIKSNQTDEPSAQETSPLLPRDEAKKEKRGVSVLYLLMFIGFVVSLSFAVTQVPKMSCDAYYENHKPPPEDIIDRCSMHEVEARMARQITLLAASTMIFGLVNLLVTGWTIKKLGVKRALLIQVFVPAIRLMIQNVGVTIGSNAGIIIVQCSQMTSIVGGPAGYVLTLNSFITGIVSHEKRTGSLGRLQGCMMVGAAIGFLAGGLIGDAFGILAPFRVTLCLFTTCCIFIAFSVPATPLEETTESHTSASTSGVMRYIGPLHIFAPQKWILPSGKSSTQIGALTLGIGVFLGILATGSLQTMLQLYSINEFNFDISKNGWLVFMYTLLRGLYLTLIFPRIISWGRQWYQPDTGKQPQSESESNDDTSPQTYPEEPPSARETDLPDNQDAETEPLAQPHLDNKKQTFAFDLLYARWSLLADGILTGCTFFTSNGQQLFILAALLPLSAGTGSAAKGSLLQMISSSERVDALSGITLVENIARLMTTTLFGLLFATFAEMGKSRLIFVCNAGVALIGFGALLFSHFPPKGSSRVR